MSYTFTIQNYDLPSKNEISFSGPNWTLQPDNSLIRPMDFPRQGTQVNVKIDGVDRTVGFYNTYAAVSIAKRFLSQFGLVNLDREIGTNYVTSMSGPFFSSVQCHLESILTLSGPEIIAQYVTTLLNLHNNNPKFMEV